MIDEKEEALEISDIAVSEYIVFLLSVDTYKRYLEETQKLGMDQTLKRGIQLLKQVDIRQGVAFQAFLDQKLESPAHKNILMRSMRRQVSNPDAMADRAQLLTLLLTRNVGMLKHIFENNQKAIRAVRTAIAASGIEDADVALEALKVIPFIKNKILERWIDYAAKQAGPGYEQNPIKAATESATDTTPLLESKIIAESELGTERGSAAIIAHEVHLTAVQESATAAAKKALEVSGAEDLPPTKSEAAGIAAAAIVEALTDTTNPRNIPEPLKRLDPEQRAAALTDGRVVVSASAGAGKSTTLISRITYLVQERGVNPSQILVTSFNTKAADELKHKIGSALGPDVLKQMSAGTINGLFRKFVVKYGTKTERGAMENNFKQGGGIIARAVQRIWQECKPDDKPPSLKKASLAMTGWKGDGINPNQLNPNDLTDEQQKYAEWYKWYQGLKGDLLDASGKKQEWEPPCKSKAYESFRSRHRPSNDIMLGDFDDQIQLFYRILKRDPAAKAEVQNLYKHILVDECQDLNGVQNEVIEMISEQIPTDSKDSSIWLVGDTRQSIFGFRGAKPEIFNARANNPKWKLREIATNYRCTPRIIDAANKLIAYNGDQNVSEARPAPGKNINLGTLKVNSYDNDASMAINVIQNFKQNIQSGGNASDHAILTRTNKEQNVFETACIVKGIPYARSGASSFLGSPETSAVLGYVQLAIGDDYAKMQKSLGEVINKPNRFFMTDPTAAPRAVEEALKYYAKRNNQQLKDVNPLVALRDSSFISDLAVKLSGSRVGDFKYKKAVGSLYSMVQHLNGIQAQSSDPEYKTKDMFDDILMFEGVSMVTNPKTGKAEITPVTFRESLMADLRDAPPGEDGDDQDEDPDDSETPNDDTTSNKDDYSKLGNVGFLYLLAETDPSDEGDLAIAPENPNGFKSKMERYASKMRDLRTDTDKWYKNQRALDPKDQKPPPGVFLTTIHKVKGSQWRDVFVSMPKGKFPMEPPPQVLEQATSNEAISQQLDRDSKSERRLAYVALTRAIENLTVGCPNQVGGKPAGISPYIAEAQLKIGENVGTQEPGQKDTVKTASQHKARVSLAYEDFYLYNIEESQ